MRIAGRLAKARRTAAFGLVLALATAGGLKNAAAFNCTAREVSDFSQIFTTLDVTRNNCKRFLERAQQGQMDKDVACRACRAAEDTKARLSSWFSDNPVCAMDLHDTEILQSLEGPASELASICSNP